jgi:sigma-B regulation protein RsbU (phosphoserine phosphatase)
MIAETMPHKVRCAEVWGGIHARQDEVMTPGVRAVIHSSASGAEKGGDLYYLSVCAFDTLTRIAIADVRGHGADASQLSEWLYKSLEARMNDPDGARVLADLNEIVRKRGFEAITTAVIATLHRSRGLLYYAYAGHPPLMLGRAGHSWRELPAATTAGPANLPLGIMPNARYVQERVRVAPGDRLFLYTDGVTECPAAGTELNPELYGDRKMCGALARYGAYPLREARQRIHDGLMEHAGGELSHDDCTFLLMEVLEPPPLWRRRILPGRPRDLLRRFFQLRP